MPEIAFRLQPRFIKPEDEPKLAVVRLNVGLDFGLDMLPYPSTLRSCVSPEAAEDLAGKVAQVVRPGRRLTLTDLRIAGQAVPDLVVVRSLAPGRLQVDGFLGLDFFEQFDIVEWRPKARLMRLISD